MIPSGVDVRDPRVPKSMFVQELLDRGRVICARPCITIMIQAVPGEWMR